MDLRQLRYFVTLAEAQNFHRAAERLNMSQPPLTVAIRKLEEELGAQLFTRTSRGVALTAAGMAALEPARTALQKAQEVGRAVALGEAGESGRLTIGFVGSAIGEMLPRILPPYRARFPDVELVLEEMASIDVLRSLEAGSIDVGFVRLPVLRQSDAVVRVIERDTLVAAVPERLGLGQSGTIDLVELAHQPFILLSQISVLHAAVLMACQKAGFTPRVAQEAQQMQTILSLVRSGLGVALVPAKTINVLPAGVRLLPLRDPITTEMGIAMRKRAEPLQTNFVQVVLDACDIH